MLVSFKLVGGGSYTTLFDETAGAQLLEEFAPDFAAKVQEEDLAGSISQFRNPIGNVKASHNLKFNQVYTTTDLALQSIRTFGSTLIGPGIKFHLQVAQGGEVQFYPNCAVSSYKPTWRGISVDHAFRLTSDTVTGSAPTT